MLNRKTLAIAAIILLGLTNTASADENDYIKTTAERKLCYPDLTVCLDLQPGRFLVEPLWQKQDEEFKRLQEQEIRLTAENKSLRKSAEEFPWLPVSLGVAVGIAVGTYIGLKF